MAAPPPDQVSPISQGPQQEQSSSDIVADIPHVQGDFVHNLYHTGALKLVHQLHLSGDAANCGKRVLFGISFELFRNLSKWHVLLLAPS